MKVEKIICDKCGADTANDPHQVVGLDFCQYCYENLRDVIQSWIDEPEAPAVPAVEVPEVVPAVINPTKKKIDWDKACALKLAGWSNKQIAEELGVNFGTINVEIYKKVNQYKMRKASEETDAKRAVLEDR